MRLGNAVLRQTGLDEAGAKDQTTAKDEGPPPHRARGSSCVATQEVELVIEEGVGAGREVLGGALFPTASLAERQSAREPSLLLFATAIPSMSSVCPCVRKT